MKFVFLFVMSLMIIFRPVMPLLDYAVNYDYISKVLCENKNKPEKKCNGKCHLKKNLNKVFKTEESSSAPLEKSNVLAELVCVYLDKFQVFDFNISELNIPKKIHFERRHLYAFDYHNDLFHPPIFI